MVTKTDIISEAKQLAQSHRKFDPNTTTIVLYSDNKDKTIKLLEVSDDVATTQTTGTAEAFLFDRDLEDGINHPLSIILASPEEYEAIKNGKLSLPRSWNKEKEREL